MVAPHCWPSHNWKWFGSCLKKSLFCNLFWILSATAYSRLSKTSKIIQVCMHMGQPSQYSPAASISISSSSLNLSSWMSPISSPSPQQWSSGSKGISCSLVGDPATSSSSATCACSWAQQAAKMKCDFTPLQLATMIHDQCVFDIV